MPDTSQSYDDRQLAAVLVKCAGCGREYYMTAPKPLCFACQRTRPA